MSLATTHRSGISFRPIGLLTAGIFLAFVVGQSPHLVHHLFEPKQTETDCAFASLGERTQGPPADIAPLIPVLGVETGVPAVDQPALPGRVSDPTRTRAPPLLAS